MLGKGIDTSPMSTFTKYLIVCGMSMVPVIELRGAVPYGVTTGLPLLPVLLTAILGNMVPVPFILLFIRKILAWMKTREGFCRRLAEKLEARALSKSDVLEKYAAFGLFVLVAIPLPGTGAWTGSLVAAVFQLKWKHAIPSIFAGVVAAGIIMSIVSYGVKALF